MRVALLSALLFCTGCFRLDPFLYVPEKVDHYVLDPAGASPEETVTADRIHPLTLVTDDGESLGAVYIDAPFQPPAGYVIFFHGKGGNLDTTMPRIKRYANLGYDCLGYDYRGWGVSTGTPSEAGMGHDGQAAIQYLQDRLGPLGKLNKLFYAGQSLGGATSTQAATLAAPKALILESTFSSLAEFTAESTQMDFSETFLSDGSWDTAGRLHAMTGVPVLILHGTDDDLIRPEHAQKNYAAANEPKQLWIQQGGGHSDLPQVMGAAYGEMIHAFVDPRLE